MGGILLAIAGNAYGSAPVNTALPAVSGTQITGQTLTTSNGTWTGAPAPTFSYQWQRLLLSINGSIVNTINIPGATSNSYTLTFNDCTALIRCVVTASNSGGSISATSASTNVIAPIYLGHGVAGTSETDFNNGLYAGKIDYNGQGIGTHYLIVSPDRFSPTNWAIGTLSGTITYASSEVDGVFNTNNLVARGTDEFGRFFHPAANFCRNIERSGGFTDWYLPAMAELEICFFNLRPDFTFQIANRFSPSVQQFYAVPNRLNVSYASAPEITKAINFRFHSDTYSGALYPAEPPLTDGTIYPAGPHAFFVVRENDPPENTQFARYWSSTAELFGSFADGRAIQFWNGAGTSGPAGFVFNTRAIRRVPISVGSAPGDGGGGGGVTGL